MRKIIAQSSLLPLEGAIQHYEWGGYEFIPHLLGQKNPEKKPYAELWIGAHSKSPSLVLSGEERLPLNDLIKDDSDRILGEEVSKRYQGKLPYLFKVLDARRMLSIQAHPNKRQAEEGYARENAAGIDLCGTSRNYKDDNHKSEAQVALTEFWMLHGFRPAGEIAALLDSTPELDELVPDFPGRAGRSIHSTRGEVEAIRSLYSRFMEMPQEEVDNLLGALLRRIRNKGTEDKNHPDYWALRAVAEFPLPDGHIDRGIFSIYLLNLVHLYPGQGTFQPAGVLHAYLEGTNIEIMANSDNVLRGGLTPKYVDVLELLRILNFEGRKPEILKGEWKSAIEKVYRTPSREFELSCIQFMEERKYQSTIPHSADSFILVKGQATIRTDQESLPLNPGGICLVVANVPYSITAGESETILYKASVPL